MDKELKGIVLEIVMLTIMLVIAVPICVNASNRYQEKKEVLLKGTDTTVDITPNGDMKKLTIYSNHKGEVSVNLTLRMNHVYNDYLVYLDNQVYSTCDLDYYEDDDYIYYNLGIYEVDGTKEFDFQLKPQDKTYYEETITYSFMTEGIF